MGATCKSALTETSELHWRPWMCEVITLLLEISSPILKAEIYNFNNCIPIFLYLGKLSLGRFLNLFSGTISIQCEKVWRARQDSKNLWNLRLWTWNPWSNVDISQRFNCSEQTSEYNNLSLHHCATFRLWSDDMKYDLYSFLLGHLT